MAAPPTIRETTIDTNEDAPTPRRPLFGVPNAERGVLCHGCTAAGRCRFGLEDIDFDEDGVLRAVVVCTSEFEGAPGMAHGGWISAVLDDMTGFATVLRDGFAVTANLKIAFKRPVPLGQRLEVSARQVPSDDGRRHVRGELRHAASGALLARAESVFVLRDESYFERG